MRFHHSLDGILGQRSKVALLRFLTRTRVQMSGRELSRALGLDHKTCHKALQDLSREGVVDQQKIGTAIVYRMNENHVIVREILQKVFEKEDLLLADYAEELRKSLGVRVYSLILFGSVVRGEEEATSDVDMVLVVKDAKDARAARDALDATAVDLSGRYGNAPQVIVIEKSTFASKARRHDPFIQEVIRTGRVLDGKPISEVLKDDR